MQNFYDIPANSKCVFLTGALASAEAADVTADQMIAAPTLLADAISGAPTAGVNEQAFSNSGANKLGVLALFFCRCQHSKCFQLGVRVFICCSLLCVCSSSVFLFKQFVNT